MAVKNMTKKQIQIFFERLREQRPSPQTELKYSSPFELLIAVMLSAQATDVSVNKATDTEGPQESNATSGAMLRRLLPVESPRSMGRDKCT